MQLAQFNKRIMYRNPIEPYSWVAYYQPMGCLKQFGFDGYHYSSEIDRARLQRLEILGHPSSPIAIPVPDTEIAPDEVVIKAQVTYQMRMGENRRVIVVRYFFGYRYGTEKYLVEIDDLGQIWKTNNELEPTTRWLSGGY